MSRPEPCGRPYHRRPCVSSPRTRWAATRSAGSSTRRLPAPQRPRGRARFARLRAPRRPRRRAPARDAPHPSSLRPSGRIVELPSISTASGVSTGRKTRKRKALFVGVVALLGVAALGLATSVAGSGRRRRRSRWPGSTRPAQRRRLVAGARRGPALRPEDARLEGADDVQGERLLERAGPAGRSPASSATATRSSSRRSFGILESASTGSCCEEVPGRQVRGGDRHAGQEEPGRVLRRRRGHDLPLRDGGRRRHEEGPDRLRRPVRRSARSFGTPTRSRSAPRRRTRARR